MKALCGLKECETCPMRGEKCGGCAETGGRPFGGACMLAGCCKSGGCENHGKAFEAPCRLKEQLICPEIDCDQVEKIRGMDICFVTTALTDDEARELLTLFGAPFSK